MTQKEMEARLVALEAEFVARRHDIDNLIRDQQNQMSFVEMEFNSTMRKHKDTIRKYEAEKQALHVNNQARRAEIYAEFAASEEQ